MCWVYVEIDNPSAQQNEWDLEVKKKLSIICIQQNNSYRKMLLIQICIQIHLRTLKTFMKTLLMSYAQVPEFFAIVSAV